MRDDHRAAREVVVEEALEPIEAGEVEVVGGLVEQEHVEAGEQDRGEVGARGLAARERAHVEVEHAFRQAEVVEHLADRGVEVGGAEREVRVEREGVRVVGAGTAVREAVARGVERLLGVGHAGAAPEVGAHGLARPPLGVLGR